MRVRVYVFGVFGCYSPFFVGGFEFVWVSTMATLGIPVAALEGSVSSPRLRAFHMAAGSRGEVQVAQEHSIVFWGVTNGGRRVPDGSLESPSLVTSLVNLM